MPSRYGPSVSYVVNEYIDLQSVLSCGIIQRINVQGNTLILG